MNTSIINDAEYFVKELYVKDDKNNLLYHNFEHATQVVARINEISSHYKISDEDTIALNIAGWFHDTGHLFTVPSEHEAKSAEIASEWMTTKPISDDIRKKVEDLIAATKLSYKPKTILEEIIKDADTYHFGTKLFKKTDKRLKSEMHLRNFTTKVSAWNLSTTHMLQDHVFYTDYCKNHLQKGKEKNITRYSKKTESSNFDNTGTTMLFDEISKVDKMSSTSSSYMAKGIQTMLRLTSENHMNLSAMADNKANILISVNAIIISLILSILMRKIQVDTYLTIPTLLFLSTSVTTIVLAILATRPKITSGKFSKEDVINGKTNLLFFGNFFRTTLDEYKWGMSMMMKDPNYLYGALVDDIFYLGVVLGKKYKLLRLAYYIFMFGILGSVIAFVIAFLSFKAGTDGAIENSLGSPF